VVYRFSSDPLPAVGWEGKGGRAAALRAGVVFRPRSAGPQRRGRYRSLEG
jgi:hypothetical protein